MKAIDEMSKEEIINELEKRGFACYKNEGIKDLRFALKSDYIIDIITDRMRCKLKHDRENEFKQKNKI